MKISVITPNYNYAHFIGKTIESVLSQDYTDVEHIIVDDGSTDNSIDVIKQYARAFPDKIKLFQQKNHGQSVALNKALENCTGEIICWLNSDDRFIPGAFKKIEKLYEMDTSLDAVFGDIIIIDENDSEVKRVRYLPFDYLSGAFNGFGKIIPSNAIFWKRALTFKNGKTEFFDSQLHYAMDSEYWSRILLNKNVKHIREFLADFRYHSSAKTIKRRVEKSRENLDSSYEDNYVKKNALSYKRLDNGIANIVMHFYFKTQRHFLKFVQGHYFK